MGNPRPIILALAFGLIAVVLVYFYIKQVEKSGGERDVQMVRVVRAIEKIPPRQPIRDFMIEEVEVPETFVTPEMITESEEILDKVSVVTIHENTILMQYMFEEESEVESMAFVIDPGERAVTVGVSEVSGLGGNVAPGDKVDVMVTITGNEEVGVPSTFTILSDIGILAVSQDIGFTQSEEGTEKSIPKSVTLRVKPYEAEILALASEVGSIRLALRNPKDPAQFTSTNSGTALTDFIRYTATRKDLEEAAKRAREEAEAAHDRYMQQRMSMGPDVSYQVPDNLQGQLEPIQTGPPPILVELILGGQSQFVELKQQ